ncbi:MAG TPA: hypothetical protein VNU93_02675 [Verrucomicrobiae bacterium]|nr:hypothetical protein [Verrucomicrobiae bacterium]
MKQVWELLSDKGVGEYLSRVELGLDEEALRLILLELLFRVNALEAQCLTLQSLLVEHEIVDPDALREYNHRAEDYLSRKDELRQREIRLMSSSGISPLEWINYVYRGKFTVGEAEL